MRRVALKRGYLLGLALFLLLVWVKASFADMSPIQNLGDFVTWKFKIGIDDRVRYEYRDNFNFSDAKPTKGTKGYGTGSLVFNRFKINLQGALSD